jgi:hypothetical protein
MIVLGVVGKAAAMLVGIGLLMRFVLPGLVRRLARSQELLVLFSIAWAVSMAMIGDMLGFSKEVGAFLAGVSLASTPFRETISSRLVSIRDFMLLFFFLHLGSTLDLSTLGTQLGTALILSFFVLIGNPIIVLIIMGAMGYRKRTGFLAGLTVAQISEFSLILGALGLSLGHINEETMGLITLVGLITIGLSTYLILYSHQIYNTIERPLSIFERKVPYREVQEGETQATEGTMVIFGLGRFGDNIAEELRTSGVRLIGIDFDPRMVLQWKRRKLNAQYGDATDPEFPSSLPLASVSWVVCAVPDLKTNTTLLKALREHGYTGKVALTAHTLEHAEVLRSAGADLVLLPFADAARQAAECLMGHASPAAPIGLEPSAGQA